MKLLTVWPINWCNFRCYYCPAKYGLEETGFQYPNEDAVSRNRNGLLFPWLDKFCNPDEWLIEITGGEPGMYPEIDSLMLGLQERGYHGIIATNGSFPILRVPNFKKVGAWHKDKKFPRDCDYVIIIKNPQDDWQSKVRYCKEQEIPFRTNNFALFYTQAQDESIPHNTYGDGFGYGPLVTEVCWINAWGQISECCKSATNPLVAIRNLSPPVVKGPCNSCVNAMNIERFIHPQILEKMKKDKEEHLKCFGINRSEGC